MPNNKEYLLIIIAALAIIKKFIINNGSYF